jgi:hypothetical protein
LAPPVAALEEPLECDVHCVDFGVSAHERRRPGSRTGIVRIQDLVHGVSIGVYSHFYAFRYKSLDL